MLTLKLNKYLKTLQNEDSITIPYIKKGDIVQIKIRISSKRVQTFTGICLRNHKNKLSSAITIKYKMSGRIVVHTIPIYNTKLVAINKL